MPFFTPVPFLGRRHSDMPLIDATVDIAEYVNFPVSIQLGDLLVLVQWSRSSSGTPTNTYPAGFTAINTITSTSGSSYERTNACWKIATGLESGALLGMNGNVEDRKFLLHYRGGTPILAVTAAGWVATAPNTDPVAQTIATSGAGTSPALGVCFYKGDADVTTRTMSVVQDHEWGTFNNTIWVRDLFQGSSPLSYTFDMGDHGNQNTLAGFYITPVFQLPPFAIALQTSATVDNTGSNYIVCPTVQDNDLIVHWDQGTTDTSTPNDVVPSGFTKLLTLALSWSGYNTRTTLSWRLATASMSGTQLHGLSNLWAQKGVYVFRGNRPIQSVAVTPSPINGQMTSGDPLAQSVPAAAAMSPMVVIGAYWASGGAQISPRTFNPAKDGEINISGEYYLAYKIYNSAPANVTIDMDDEGSANALMSACFACSEGPPAASTLAYVNHTTHEDSGSITLPTNILAGDLLVIIHDAGEHGGGTTARTPSGFSLIGTTGNEMRVSAHYKIAVGNESSTSVNVNQAGGTGGDEAICLHYRANAPIVSATFGHSVIQQTSSNPSPEPMTISALARPLACWAYWACEDSTFTTHTTTGPGWDHDIAVSGYTKVADKIITGAQADFTIDMNSEGANNTLWCIWTTEILV